MNTAVFSLTIFFIVGKGLALGVHYQNTLQDHLVQAPLNKWIDTGCNCYKYTCGCCAHMEVAKIHLNDTGCVNFTYLPKDYGISFVFTIDNLTIYNETISAREPPPLCFGAPVIEQFADLCVHFYDLNATWHMLHGCVKVEARLHHVVLTSYKLGCFTIGHNSTLLAGIASKVSSGKTYIPKISKYQVNRV